MGTAAAVAVIAVPGENMPAGHDGKADMLRLQLTKLPHRLIRKALPRATACLPHPHKAVYALQVESIPKPLVLPGHPLPFFCPVLDLGIGRQGQRIVGKAFQKYLSPAKAQHRIRIRREQVVKGVVQFSKSKILQHGGLLFSCS